MRKILLICLTALFSLVTQGLWAQDDSGPTYPCTATWDWQNDNPTGIQSATNFTNTTGYLESSEEGISLYVDASSSKRFYMPSSNAYAALTNGGKLQIPVTSTSDIITVVNHVSGTVKYYNYTIGGITADSPNFTYNVTTEDVAQGYVEIVSTGSCYFYSISAYLDGVEEPTFGITISDVSASNEKNSVTFSIDAGRIDCSVNKSCSDLITFSVNGVDVGTGKSTFQNNDGTWTTYYYNPAGQASTLGDANYTITIPDEYFIRTNGSSVSEGASANFTVGNPSAVTCPFTFSPESEQTVESIKDISISYDKGGIIVNLNASDIKVLDGQGNEVATFATILGASTDVVTLSLASAITDPGTYTIVIPALALTAGSSTAQPYLYDITLTYTIESKPVTATWDWVNDNPIGIQSATDFTNKTGYLESSEEGISLYVDASSSKRFYMPSSKAYAILNNGAKLQIPVTSTSDIITVVNHTSGSVIYYNYTIGGTAADSPNVIYQVTEADVAQGYVEIVSTGSCYFYSISAELYDWNGSTTPTPATYELVITPTSGTELTEELASITFSCTDGIALGTEPNPSGDPGDYTISFYKEGSDEAYAIADFYTQTDKVNDDGSYTFTFYDTSLNNEKPLSESGTYTATIPAGMFLLGPADSQVESEQVDYTIEISLPEATTFELSFDPAEGTVELNPNGTFGTIKISNENGTLSLANQKDATIILTDGTNEVAHGIYEGTSTESSITFNIYDASETNMWKPEAGTYTLSIAEGFFKDGNEKDNASAEITYTIEGDTSFSLTFDPENSSNVDEIFIIKVSSDDIVQSTDGNINAGSEALDVTDGSGQVVARVFYENNQYASGYSFVVYETGSMTEKKITESGTYTIEIPAGWFYTGISKRECAKTTLTYTIGGEEGGDEFELKIGEPTVNAEDTQLTVTITSDETLTIADASVLAPITITVDETTSIVAYARIVASETEANTYILYFVDEENKAIDITTEGEYTVTIPEGFFTYESGELSEETSFNFTITAETPVVGDYPFTFTPASGSEVTSLSTIIITNGDTGLTMSCEDPTTIKVYDENDDVVTTVASIEGDGVESLDTQIVLTLEETITTSGEYKVVIPEGTLFDGLADNAYPADITLTYTVAGKTFTITPQEGDVETLSEFTVTYEDGIALAKGTIDVYVQKDGVNVYGAEALANDTICAEDGTTVIGYKFAILDLEGNETTITEPGTYTITIEAGKFLLGEDETPSPSVTITYTVTGEKAELVILPEIGVVDDLSVITITCAAGMNLNETFDTYLYDKEKNKVAAVEALTSDKITDEDGKTIGYTLTLLDLTSYDETTITDAGEYTLTIPYGTFTYGISSIPNDELILTYTIEGEVVDTYTFEFDPASGETVESLSTIKITNGEAGLTMSCDASDIKVYDENDDVVTTVASIDGDGVESLDSYIILTLAKEITEPGTYTVVIPEDVLFNGMADEPYSKPIKLTYTIATNEEPKVVGPGTDLPEGAIFTTDFTDWRDLSYDESNGVVVDAITTTDEAFTFTLWGVQVNTGDVSQYNDDGTAKFEGEGALIFAKYDSQYSTCEPYVETSTISYISKITFTEAVTGSNRGVKISVKGEDDEDWEVVYNTSINSGATEVEVEVNRTNCQIKIESIALNQNTYVLDFTIYGKVEEEEPTPKSPYVFDEVEEGVYAIIKSGAELLDLGFLGDASACYATFSPGDILYENDSITVAVATDQTYVANNGYQLSDIQAEHPDYTAFVNFGSKLSSIDETTKIEDPSEIASGWQGALTITPKAKGGLTYNVHAGTNIRTFGIYDVEANEWVTIEHEVTGDVTVEGQLEKGKDYLLVGTGTNSNLYQITFVPAKVVGPGTDLPEGAIFATDFTDWDDLSYNESNGVVVDAETTTGEEFTFTLWGVQVNTGDVSQYNEDGTAKFEGEGALIFAKYAEDGSQQYSECEPYVETSTISSVTKITFTEAVTGSNRGVKISVKGDGDDDWVVVYSTSINSGATEVTVDINRTNCQIKIESIATNQNTYILDFTIYGEEEVVEPGPEAESVKGTITWPFTLGTEGQEATYSVGTDEAYESNAVAIGSNLSYAGTRTVTDANEDNETYGETVTFTLFDHQEQQDEVAETNAIDFTVTMAEGYGFAPTQVSLYATRVGTDACNMNISWIDSEGNEIPMIATSKDTGDNPGRANGTPNTFTKYTLDLSEYDIATTEDGTFKLRVNVFGMANSKTFGLSDIIISGTVIGVSEDDIYAALSEEIAALETNLDATWSTIQTNYPTAAEDASIIAKKEEIESEISALKTAVDASYADGTLSDEAADYEAQIEAIQAEIEQLLADAIATGIDSITIDNFEGKSIYTISGQKVSAPTKAGIYIIDGKKVVIK